MKNKTASFLVVKDVPKNVCVFGAENSFNKKAVVPKKNFETAKIYNFTNEERELEIELNLKKGSGVKKTLENITLSSANKAKNFDHKKCIQCEKLQSCRIIKAIKLAKVYAPWVKFLK